MDQQAEIVVGKPTTLMGTARLPGVSTFYDGNGPSMIVAFRRFKKANCLH